MRVQRSTGRGGNGFAEHEVVAGVTDLLVSERYRVRHEVPNMGQSADIVATRGKWVTFIEAKVRDWRRAMLQCRAHEQVADFICIAVGAKALSDELLRQSKARGYGVISYRGQDHYCGWVFPPARNERVWAPQRQRLARVMRKIPYAH